MSSPAKAISDVDQVGSLLIRVMYFLDASDTSSEKMEDGGFCYVGGDRGGLHLSVADDE